MNKDVIAVFDFDGTLTNKDTLLDFIRYAKGRLQFCLGMLLLSPILMLFKAGFIPNWKAKQIVLRFFFGGMPYKTFCRLGEEYASRIDSILKPETMSIMQQHIADGHHVFVITASVYEWVAPWCMQHGVEQVLTTRLATDEQEVCRGMECERLTGKLKSKNCYGKEKVRRLLEILPNRDEYILYAYGDSRGDRELLAFADNATWCK